MHHHEANELKKAPSEDDHEECFVLGAYAVGACDPIEEMLIEAHLCVCGPCRTEVTGLREVTTRLDVAGPWRRRPA